MPPSSSSSSSNARRGGGGREPLSREPLSRLPRVRHLLAVCAHPDDESFGLGALLSEFRTGGAEADLLCFTHGEASTLGDSDGAGLAAERAAELEMASGLLGVGQVILLNYADGALSDVSLDDLAGHVTRASDGIDALLVFDEGGITGHPDHCRATEAAVTSARAAGIPVFAWCLPDEVARALNSEFGTGFAGRGGDEFDFRIAVDRGPQMKAMACHGSQLTGNPVPLRRIELQGKWEHLRVLVDPGRVFHRKSPEETS